MSDPYNEVSKRQKGHGFSPLAWLGIAVASFVAVGLVGVVGVGLFVANKVQGFAEDLSDNPVEVLVDVAERFDIEVLEQDEQSGVLTLRMADGEEPITIDLSNISQSFRDGFDGLEGLDEVGVRFKGEASDKGGVLSIHTKDGETRIELRAGDDGGFLHIETPDDEMHFGAGSSAASLPDWVPVYPGGSIENVMFSAETSEGAAGGFLLKVDDSPSDVLEWYADRLSAVGEDSESSRLEFSGNDQRVEFEWVTSQGNDRSLTVVSGEDDDGQRFVLLFHKTER